MVKELLQDYGYEPERFHIAWCSSAEPDKFVEAVTKMTNQVKSLGPHHNSLTRKKAA